MLCLDDTEALRCGDRASSWAQVHKRANGVAAGLVTAGVRRLAVLDLNDPATIDAAYGASRAGAVLTIVNWRLASEELAYVLCDSESELLLVGAPFAEVVAGLRDRLPLLREVDVAGRSTRRGWRRSRPSTCLRPTRTPRCCSCTRRGRPGSPRA